MPWKEETVENQRVIFAARAAEEGCNFSQLCRDFGITRKTGYKWVERFRNGEALVDQSRAPSHRPNKTPPETEELIVSVRLKHPTWGGRKIVRYLVDKGNDGIPVPSVAAKILKRNGLISPEASAQHVPFKRFERAFPNDLWQMDFKGHIAMNNGLRCHPLTMQDDHSRKILCLDAYDNERWPDVEASLKRVFLENGLPNAILCDNGKPWGDSRGGYTYFDLWMMQMDVLPIHGRMLHPQTQGKEERFHRTLNEDLFMRTPIQDLDHAQHLFDAYRLEYNSERPHEALKLDVPNKHYKASTKYMPEILTEPEYESGKTLRKVNAKGYISIRNHRYYLSDTFINKFLEVVPVDDKTIFLCYGQFIVAKIDLEEQLLISRKIFRR